MTTTIDAAIAELQFNQYELNLLLDYINEDLADAPDCSLQKKQCLIRAYYLEKNCISLEKSIANDLKTLPIAIFLNPNIAAK